MFSGDISKLECRLVELAKEAVACLDAEDWVKSLALLDEAYEGFKELLPKRALDVVNIQIERSRCLCLLSSYEKAEESLAEAKSILDRIPAEVEDQFVVLQLRASFSEALASLRRYQGRYAEGLGIVQNAISKLNDHSDLSYELHQLLIHRGMLQKYLGRYEAANESYLASLRYHSAREMQEEKVLADIYYNLSGVCHAQKKGDAGARYGIKALRLRMASPAQGKSLVALTFSMIAANLIHKKYFKLATRMVEKSLLIQHDIYGEQHRDIAMNLNHLGVISYSLGDLSKADFYFLTALEMQKICLDRFHPDLVFSLNNLLTVKVERQELQVIPEYQATFKELLEKNKDVNFSPNPKLLVAPPSPNNESHYRNQ